MEGSRYKLSPAESYNGKMIDNAKLTLRSVDFDDAGNYYCFASQEMWPDVNSTQVLLVRVKGTCRLVRLSVICCASILLM